MILRETADRHRQHSQRGQAAATAGAATRREQAGRRNEALLGVIARLAMLYPRGIISARDTWVWRDLADSTGATEAELSRLAADAGYWPWTDAQIRRAVRDGTDDGAMRESAITDEEKALFRARDREEPAPAPELTAEEQERLERRRASHRASYARRRENPEFMERRRQQAAARARKAQEGAAK